MLATPIQVRFSSDSSPIGELEKNRLCFVGKNDDYCPYNLKIVDTNKTSIYKPDKFDSDYYKNESIYIFNGYYENNLCTYANYFYGVEESSFEYSSELYMTV